MVDKSDWRLTNQINYLKNVKITRVKYYNQDKEWDHEHCAFCWKKFNNDNLKGYCTLDQYHWICDDCFNDFKEMFKWIVVK